MHNIINIAERVGEGSWQKWKQDFEEGPLKFSCGLDVTHCDAFHFALMFVLNVCDGRPKLTKILSRRGGWRRLNDNPIIIGYLLIYSISLWTRTCTLSIVLLKNVWERRNIFDNLQQPTGYWMVTRSLVTFHRKSCATWVACASVIDAPCCMQHWGGRTSFASFASWAEGTTQLIYFFDM